MKKTDKYIISQNSSIREAISKLDLGGIGFITCVDENQNVIGILTDGDFRRAILNGISLNEDVSIITNKNFIRIGRKHNSEEIKNIFNTTVVKHIPVIENGKLIEIITEEDIFTEKKQKFNQIDLPVVIMAGGKGTRLDPFTRILPKPLIPIGNKPMIEVIMDKYAKYGMKNFYITINHKGKMIKAYFEDFKSDYKIRYVEENKPLGTAGSLKYLNGKINTPFFVSNCDIIIKDDYTKIYNFHKKGGYALTLVASMQNHVIPYGVCEIENGGILKKITEKPQYDFLVNTGMYILNHEILEYIPKNEFYHITHLIEKLQTKGYKVGVYPVSEKSWIDVGQWEDYKRALNNIH